MKLAFLVAFFLPASLFLAASCLFYPNKALADSDTPTQTTRSHRLLRGNIEQNDNSLLLPGHLRRDNSATRLLRSSTTTLDTNQSVTIMPRLQSSPYSASTDLAEPINMEISEEKLLDSKLASQNFTLKLQIPKQSGMVRYSSNISKSSSPQVGPGEFYWYTKHRLRHRGPHQFHWDSLPDYRLQYKGCCNNSRSTSLSGRMLNIGSVLNTPSVLPGPLTMPPMPIDTNLSYTINHPSRPTTMVAEDTLWTPWYDRFGLALYQAWKLPATMQGTAVLKLTVTRSGNIRPSLLSTDNYTDTFRQSLLKAVKSLERSEFTRFPAGSQRSSVTFQARLESAFTTIGGASSLITSDVERHWRIIPLQ